MRFLVFEDFTNYSFEGYPVTDDETVIYYQNLWPGVKREIYEGENIHWQAEVDTKIELGTYDAVPWSKFKLQLSQRGAFLNRFNRLQYWQGLHLSTNNPELLAYWPNFKAGMEKKATAVKPGRWLQKYFSDLLSPDEIRYLAGMFVQGNLELKFARTADEIEAIYLKGPGSCMSHPASNYQSPEHPVRLYAGVFELAYLERFGTVTDRALVWRDEKVYGRIYGAADGVMQRLLEEAGFTSKHFSGARLPLRRVTPQQPADSSTHYYLMPYVDYTPYGVISGNEVILQDTVNGSNVMLNSTNGLLAVQSCFKCEAMESSLTAVYDYYRGPAHRYCSHCANQISFMDADDCRNYLSEDRVEGYSGASYSYSRLRYQGYTNNYLACPVQWPIRRVDDILDDIPSPETVSRRRRRGIRPSVGDILMPSSATTGVYETALEVAALNEESF